LILGAAGGVGHMAVQLAVWRGAQVAVTATKRDLERLRDLGADEAFDRDVAKFEELEPVDLVFDTVGRDALKASAAALRDGGRLVSVAEEPPAEIAKRGTATYFVVESNRDQLAELTRLAETGRLKIAIDSEFPLVEARAAFERSLASGKRGKVVLRLVP
jgi:NADPH:quinone reductase-like Zn-dependent oxidoreductase